MCVYIPSVLDWSLIGSFSLSCGLGVVVRMVVGRVARVVLCVAGGCVWDLFAGLLSTQHLILDDGHGMSSSTS